MPNRIIKESIRTSDTISQLTWFEECLFYRLIVSCDDYGRFDGRLAIIKGTCFPLDDVTNRLLSDAIVSLERVGLVIRYEVAGRPYLQVRTWDCHQTVRAKKSKYPSVEEGTIKESSDVCPDTSANICKQVHADANKCLRNPIQSDSDSESESKSYSGDERLDEVLNDYIAFRKKIKKPMTDRAVQLAVAKLRKLSNSVDEQIEIVNQSILNGWQGLFPLKEKEFPGKAGTEMAGLEEFLND